MKKHTSNEIAFRFEPIPQAAGGTATTLIKLVWEGCARISFGSPPGKKSNSQTCIPHFALRVLSDQD